LQKLLRSGGLTKIFIALSKRDGEGYMYYNIKTSTYNDNDKSLGDQMGSAASPRNREFVAMNAHSSHKEGTHFRYSAWSADWHLLKVMKGAEKAMRRKKNQLH
jgi:hypothetical protein